MRHLLRRRRLAAQPGLTARCRADLRTKHLIPRLERGEIAVIDHADLDRVAADGLIAAGAVAVVNASASMTGRYPALGALTLMQADVPILDSIGADAFARVREGDMLTLHGNRLLRGDQEVAHGRRPTRDELELILTLAREAVRGEIGRFAANTLEYLAHEPEILTGDLALPPLRVTLRGRHVLVVVRGLNYREDLAALRRSGYISDMSPVLIGVDGGADALLDMGLRPDLIVGDFDSASPAALGCGAQLIVHAYRDGDAPGAERLAALGHDFHLVEAVGTSEDLALRLAFEQGAVQIVEVGSQTSVIDFFDKGRKGMASTFLTRLRVAPVLVDAKGVSRLYRTQVRKRDIAMLVASALVTLGIVGFITEPVRLLVRNAWISLGL